MLPGEAVSRRISPDSRSRRITTSVTIGSRSRSMRMASKSLIRSRTVSFTRRGWSRSRACRSASRPSGMRAVQRVPSAVPTRATRSPSATPPARKSATAVRARTASAGPKCSSSNTITKVAGSRPGGRRFEVVRGSGTGVAPAAGAAAAETGRCTASNATISWGTPSSVTVKSSRRRSRTGSPSRPVATTSTVTISACAGKEGFWPADCGRTAAGPSRAKPAARRTTGATRLGNSLTGVILLVPHGTTISDGSAVRRPTQTPARARPAPGSAARGASRRPGTSA